MAWAISPMNCRTKPPRTRRQSSGRRQSRTPRVTMRPIVTVPPRRDSSTIDTPATMVAESDAPGVRGEPPGHGNDQSQSGNADPGNNGLGHQPRELPSQAVAPRSGTFRRSWQSRTPREAVRPIVTVPPRRLARPSIRPRQRSRRATPRAFEASPPGMGTISRSWRTRTRATMAWAISPVNRRAKPRCRRLRTFHRSRQSRTPRETMRPTLTVPPRRTRRRSIPPARRSRIPTHRARKVRPPGT